MPLLKSTNNIYKAFSKVYT